MCSFDNSNEGLTLGILWMLAFLISVAQIMTKATTQLQDSYGKMDQRKHKNVLQYNFKSDPTQRGYKKIFHWI